MHLGSDPKAKVRMNAIDLLGHLIETLFAEFQGEMTVLQDHPRASAVGLHQQSACVNLLALSHRYDVIVDGFLLRQGFDLNRGIVAHREKADHRRALVGLVPHLLHVENDTFGVLRSQRIDDVIVGRLDEARRRERTNEKQATKFIQMRFPTVGQLDTFRFVFLQE